jgi:NTP pyrophosphatase (non-canonical NTP hydrolase)
MELNEFQNAIAETDQTPTHDSNGIVVALLGLAGETGSLLTLYKKFLRDGDAYQVINARLKEEIGDILWYVARIASRFEISLEDVAAANLGKVTQRWLPSNTTTFSSFDDRFPPTERFPRIFTAEFRNTGPRDRPRLEVYLEGEKCGSTLTDNAYQGDDYRYHDIIHLSFATVLGWSPVLRALIKRKRKSNPLTDEVEDGGRAVAVEEGLAALIFNYARQHSLLEEVSRLDWPLLRTCHEMSAHLEVSARSLNDWEDAILQAFSIWREMRHYNGGSVVCNLDTRRMRYIAASNP